MNSGIGVEIQGTHRSLKIPVIDSFQFIGIKTLTSSMSKRRQYFYGVMFRLLTPFDSHIFMEIISSSFQEILS